MPAFQYTAIDPAGDLSRGLMEATTEAEVIERLRRQGNIPVRAQPMAARSFISGLLSVKPGRGRALSRQEVANITRELAIMLGAGQDIDRTLRFLVETAPNGRVRGVIEQVRAAVQDGSPLALALARHPQSFSRLHVGLVRAGETGGTLAATLDQLAFLLERQRAMAAAVKSAMIYPCLLLLAAVGSIGLLLTQVLPQFVPLFEQNGVALPTPTRILIAVGDLVSNWGAYALLALLLLTLAGRQALQRPATRLLTDRLLLRLPILGSLTREVLAARFSRTLGTLVVNGVPLVTALVIVKDIVGNLAGVAAVERATQSVKDGAGLSRPLAETGIFPIRMIYLLRLGEEQNAPLGAMALRAADIHEENTRIALQRLVALLVPAITVAMGAVIAAIVAALLLAMLGLNDVAA